MKTAILVDGGFYRRRAQNALGDISAQERATDHADYLTSIWQLAMVCNAA